MGGCRVRTDKLDVVVELGRRSDDPADRLKRITAWLNARPDVQSCRMGEEFDIWHGNFQDIEDEIERMLGGRRLKHCGLIGARLLRFI